MKHYYDKYKERYIDREFDDMFRDSAYNDWEEFLEAFKSDIKLAFFKWMNTQTGIWDFYEEFQGEEWNKFCQLFRKDKLVMNRFSEHSYSDWNDFILDYTDHIDVARVLGVKL